jgi:hypothetical protein
LPSSLSLPPDNPPGICGEVLRHNQSHNINASPLFYADVENMDQLKPGLLGNN